MWLNDRLYMWKREEHTIRGRHIHSDGPAPVYMQKKIHWKITDEKNNAGTAPVFMQKIINWKITDDENNTGPSPFYNGKKQENKR
jgi:hypothetical protein